MIVDRNVTITAGNPMILNGTGPQVLVFENITFETGAELQIFSDTVIHAQNITFMGDNYICVLGVNGQNAVAGSADLNGGNGTDTPNVVINVNTFSGGGTISVLAGNGGNGADGCPNGGNGGNGGNGSNVVFRYGIMEANSFITPRIAISYGGAPGKGIKPAHSDTQPQDGYAGANGFEGTIVVQPFN